MRTNSRCLLRSSQLCSLQRAFPLSEPRLHIVYQFLTALLLDGKHRGRTGHRPKIFLPPAFPSRTNTQFTPSDVRKLSSAGLIVVNGFGPRSMAARKFLRSSPRVRSDEWSSLLRGLNSKLISSEHAPRSP